MQEFDFSMNHIEGASNIIADTMSRLCANLTSNDPKDREKEVDDSLSLSLLTLKK
jgi:hypothetical protein